MLKVTFKPTVDFDDIANEFDAHISDYHFTGMVENGSYAPLWLDDDRVNELQEDIAACDDGSEDKYVNRCKKELELINKFRAMGYTDSILVFVSW